MFDNKTERYMTRTIAEELHMEIAFILWQLIDAQNEQNVETDYLQVFELSVSDSKQVIIHRQEVPEIKGSCIRTLEDTEPITSTIWCIDNGDGQVMLFPEDY